jgi:outer membrane protein OmpA-like peptidoglycan-associated protein
MLGMKLKTAGLALISTVAFMGPALACPQYDAVVTAVQAGDKALATQLHEEIVVSAECDDALREWVGDYLARESFLFAMQEATSIEEKREAFKRALGFEKHWRSYAELGRLEWGVKNYAPAAASFQLALNELVDGDPSHQASEEEIAEVYQLASAAIALADQPVSMPTTRSGDAGGIFKTKIRGFEVEEVPLPITFEFDSTTFDAVGLTYAEALVSHVMQLSPDVVRLAGHTDPQGSEDYNLSLSEARAAALRDFMRERGYDGEIEIIGLGESQLPEPPQGIEVGSEEHYRIARRVAFSAE